MHTLRYSSSPPTRKAMSARVRVTRYASMDCVEVLVSSQLSSTTRLTTFTARPRLVMAGVNCAWKKRRTNANVVSEAIHKTRVKLTRGTDGWSFDVTQLVILVIVHSELEVAHVLSAWLMIALRIKNCNQQFVNHVRVDWKRCHILRMCLEKNWHALMRFESQFLYVIWWDFINIDVICWADKILMRIVW